MSWLTTSGGWRCSPVDVQPGGGRDDGGRGLADNSSSDRLRAGNESRGGLGNGGPRRRNTRGRRRALKTLRSRKIVRCEHPTQGHLLDLVTAPALDHFQDAKDPGETSGLLEPPVGVGASGTVISSHGRSILGTGLLDWVVEAQGDPESLLDGSQVASIH